MIDILKLFYTTHYNLGAFAILLLLLLIFFLSKKNFKGAIIVGILLIAYNVGIYKRTEDGHEETCVAHFRHVLFSQPNFFS